MKTIILRRRLPLRIFHLRLTFSQLLIHLLLHRFSAIQFPRIVPPRFILLKIRHSIRIVHPRIPFLKSPTFFLLDEYVPLVNSFDLLGADASVDKMLCLGYGYYTMVFANGTTERLKMY
jgi:hypothetical protein